MDMPVTDRITSLLSSFLSVQSKRSQVISSNISNADTPGFTAKEFDFADHLRHAARQALTPRYAQTQFSEQASALLNQPRLVEQTGSPASIDGNTVDMGREMAAMTESGMQYLAGVQLLQSRLRTLRAAIREGR